MASAPRLSAAWRIGSRQDSSGPSVPCMATGGPFAIRRGQATLAYCQCCLTYIAHMSRFLDTTTRKLDDAHLFQRLVLGGRDHRRGAGGRVRDDRRGLDHIAAGRAARRGLDGTTRPRVLSRAAERPIVTA